MALLIGLMAVRPLQGEGEHAAESQISRVVFITAKDCRRCDETLATLKSVGGAFDKLRGAGWKIGEGPENHLQIVDRETVADLVQQLEVREFPTVACIEKEQVVRSFKSGCTTPLDVWTFGWLAKGIDERPEATVTEVAQVETTGNYRLRGNHWSIDEDWNPPRERVINHLRGPAHGHQAQAYGAIESWSHEELRSLHDDLHERELGSGNGRGRNSSTSQSFGAGRKISGKF